MATAPSSTEPVYPENHLYNGRAYWRKHDLGRELAWVVGLLRLPTAAHRSPDIEMAAKIFVV